MMKKTDYLTYKHSYAHAIKPKLNALKYHAFVGRKHPKYLKTIVKNLLMDSEVRWTDKEQEFFADIMEKETAAEIYYHCRNSVNKAKSFTVYVDEDGELVG